MSRQTKQVPGLYERLNSETQLMEQRSNRALRRRNMARARKNDPKLKALYREGIMHQDLKASRIYSG